MTLSSRHLLVEIEHNSARILLIRMFCDAAVTVRTEFEPVNAHWVKTVAYGSR